MTSSSSPIAYECIGAVAYATLADPARGNAADLAFVTALSGVAEMARKDDVHVFVLRAEGREFSVGGDIGAFAGAEDPPTFVRALADGMHTAVQALMQLDAIVVSVVSGIAAGAGFPLAAAADIVIASDTSRFVLAYTKIGLTPDGGSSLLTSTLGLHRTLHYALLNPTLSAQELQAAGLVAQVHPEANLDAAVQNVVKTLGSGSRTAQVATKRLLRGRVTPDPMAVLDREAEFIAVAAGTPDGREGVRAFTEKRPPRYGE